MDGASADTLGRLRGCSNNEPESTNLSRSAQRAAPARIPGATKATPRDQHAGLDPFALKKNLEGKPKQFLTVRGNLEREATTL